MQASAINSVIIILVCAVCTFAERLFPFVVFGRKKVPEVISYLGKVLPAAVIAALVIYCMRSVSFASVSGFLPQLIAAAITAALHLWKGNTLISIVGGTAAYMALIRIM